jgi:chromosome segregation ATPase
MQKDFQFIHEQTETMKAILERKKRMLPEMERQVQEYEREFNDMTQLQKLRDQIRDLKHQLAWATVQIKEQVFFIFLSLFIY